MANRVLALMTCFGALPPERKALVARVYVEARDAGMGDGDAADLVFGRLTDAEKEASDVHPPDAPTNATNATKATRPKSPARAAG